MLSPTLTHTKPLLAIRILSFSAVVAWAFLAATPNTVHAQQNEQHQSVQPMGKWLEFRKARYVTKPILLHLRSGYERAVLMPEPIQPLDQDQFLPNCAVEINNDVIGFYPTATFPRKPIKFKGLNTGKIYELRVRASPLGMRQPLQITW